MIDVFLSASVPLPEGNRQSYETADVLAIREALKALVEVVLPIGRITFGGHPAITPLIAFFVREGSFDRDRLTIYQSAYFADKLPVANVQFHDVRVIDAVYNDRERSLLSMRETMINSRLFRAAVLIGGMAGVLEEAELFGKLNPKAMMLPVASTGGAAADVFRWGGFPAALETQLSYLTLFRRYIAEA